MRPAKELTTRFCFINFDGELALNQSRSLGLQNEIDETFLEKYCGPTMDGVQVSRVLAAIML